MANLKISSSGLATSGEGRVVTQKAIVCGCLQLILRGFKNLLYISGKNSINAYLYLFTSLKNSLGWPWKYLYGDTSPFPCSPHRLLFPPPPSCCIWFFPSIFLFSSAKHCSRVASQDHFYCSVCFYYKRMQRKGLSSNIKTGKKRSGRFN